MFFVHGGAFYAGTQIKMGPERLGDVADIVLVAINYRVGPLGKIPSLIKTNNNNKNVLPNFQAINQKSLKYISIFDLYFYKEIFRTSE